MICHGGGQEGREWGRGMDRRVGGGGQEGHECQEGHGGQRCTQDCQVWEGMHLLVECFVRPLDERVDPAVPRGVLASRLLAGLPRGDYSMITSPIPAPRRRFARLPQISHADGLLFGRISGASRVHLGRISGASRVHLGRISCADAHAT